MWLFSSENGFVSVNFGCVVRQSAGKFLGKTATVSMVRVGFEVAVHPPFGGLRRDLGGDTMRTLTERHVNLVRSIVECPVSFSVDCLLGLKDSEDPSDREAFHEAVSFMVDLHSRLDRILSLCRPTEGSPADYPDPEDDPFTP